MRTDTTAPAPVTLAPTLDRDARILKEAFGRCRRDVSVVQSNEYARNVAKRIGSGRMRIAEHVMTLAWDAFTRRAPQDDVEAFGHIYITIVRSWYAATNRGETPDIPALVRDVLEAQNAATLAEFACLTERSPKAIADAEEALTREEIAIERELEVLRRLRYASAA
jgi:hypothetical protein